MCVLTALPLLSLSSFVNANDLNTTAGVDPAEFYDVYSIE